MLGLAALPLVAIPHPLAGNDEALVAAKGRAIAGEVELALTGDAAQVARRYAERFTRLTDRRLAGGVPCLDAVCAVDPGLSDPAA